MAKHKPNAIRYLTTRMPEHLRRRLAMAAKQNGKSLNAELNRRLEQSFEADGLRKMIAEAVYEAKLGA